MMETTAGATSSGSVAEVSQPMMSTQRRVNPSIYTNQASKSDDHCPECKCNPCECHEASRKAPTAPKAKEFGLWQNSVLAGKAQKDKKTKKETNESVKILKTTKTPTGKQVQGNYGLDYQPEEKLDMYGHSMRGSPKLHSPRIPDNKYPGQGPGRPENISSTDAFDVLKKDPFGRDSNMTEDDLEEDWEDIKNAGKKTIGAGAIGLAALGGGGTQAQTVPANTGTNVAQTQSVSSNAAIVKSLVNPEARQRFLKQHSDTTAQLKDPKYDHNPDALAQHATYPKEQHSQYIQNVKNVAEFQNPYQIIRTALNMAGLTPQEVLQNLPKGYKLPSTEPKSEPVRIPGDPGYKAPVNEFKKSSRNINELEYGQGQRQLRLAEVDDKSELDSSGIQRIIKKMAAKHQDEKWTKEQLAALGKKLAAAGRREEERKNKKGVKETANKPKSPNRNDPWEQGWSAAHRLQSNYECPYKKGTAEYERWMNGYEEGSSQRGHYDESVKEGSDQQLTIQQLATISDEALDNAYHYGRSTPGNTFGWQANLKSAAYAKQMIDKGITDIEAISDAIHKGWNVTAKAFVQNPDKFDDTKKLKAAGKLEAKLQQREKLMNIGYSQLPDEEQEKDRVVARALLQAITGQQDMSEAVEDHTKIKVDRISSKYPGTNILTGSSSVRVGRKGKSSIGTFPTFEIDGHRYITLADGNKIERALRQDVAEDLEESKRTMSRAAKGNEKYGKDGMQALAKAGREGKDLDKIRAKYNKYDEDIEEGWSQKYKNSINCSHPKGFSQKAHCAGKKKHNESIEMEMTCEDCGMCKTHGDHNHNALDEACWKGYHKEGMKTMFGKEYPNCKKNKNESLETYIRKGECPGCGGSMIAEGQLNEKQDACYHKVKSRYKVWPSAYASGALVQCRKKGAANWGNSTKKESIDLDENLHDWFGKEKWVRMDTKGNIKGPCARGSKSEGKPKCLPQSKAHSIGKKGRASAATKKRREDPNPERSGKAINVKTSTKSTAKTEGMSAKIKPIQELSSAILDRYKEKAKKSSDELIRQGKYRKANDRTMNVMKATGKQIDNTVSSIRKSLRNDKSVAEGSNTKVTKTSSDIRAINKAAMKEISSLKKNK